MNFAQLYRPESAYKARPRYHIYTLALSASVVLVGCATPELTNITPANTPRDASGVYTLSAQVDPEGNQIAHVSAILNGIAWPMMPTGSTTYAVAYFADACETTIPYRYTLGYQRRRLLGSGFTSAVHEKNFPEAGGYVLELTGDPPPDDCPMPVGSSFTVDSTVDAVDAEPGDGTCRTTAGACTLRAAVMEANASTGHYYISVPAGRYGLTLTGSEATDVPDDAVNDLDITGAVTLTGNRLAERNADLRTIINGNDIDRIFDIYTPSEHFVTLAYLRLQNGRSVDSGGGGIWNRGSLRMDRIALQGNEILLRSGGSCAASVSMRICNRGGGLLNEGQALILHSTIAENSTTTGRPSGRGGGISNLGPNAALYLRRSLVTDNDARFNGGLANYQGEVVIRNTTFANNRSTASGASASEIGNFDGSVAARNATFHNQFPLFGNNRGGILEIANSLVNIDSSTDIAVCDGPLRSGGYNVIAGRSEAADYFSGCGYTANPLDKTAVRLFLPALDYNGGPTRTIALRPREDSPYFDPIDFGGLLCPGLDQRGSPRDDGTCDAGAYEH